MDLRIHNEKEYEAARKQVSEFHASIVRIESEPGYRQNRMNQLSVNALRSVLIDFHREMLAYDERTMDVKQTQVKVSMEPGP